MDTRELAGKAFTCLPGCGFCCTFQPEVSRVEFRGLSKALPFVPVVHDGGRAYLGLQGGQGACALLGDDRACSAYEARPSHCRYFPFHVYFGERTEVYVDLTCRGVVDAEGSLDEAFAASGAKAAAAERGDEAAAARKAHRRFRERAEAAEAWREPAPLIADLSARAGTVATRAGLEALALRAGEAATAEDLLDQALGAFEGEVSTRPFWLTEDLRWLTFERDGDALAALEMSPDGALARRGVVQPEPAAPEAVAEALAPYARLLFGRNVFFGSACARVDDHEYAFALDAGIAARAAEVAADLALRARIVSALAPSLSPTAVATEVARFYDADFLDSETIGGFL